MVGFASGRSGGRLLAAGLIASVTALALSTVPADARRHHRSKSSHQAPRAERYTPPYSDIVVDANSGKVLHQASADAIRHPASLTKIMTLYMLFERLETGKIKLSTPLTVSAHAASMAPSKLGLKPGDTIRVEDAIKAVVTKSANDVAVVIAENLGGDEATFCAMMTRKAHALGMRQTTYRNASGLPNPGQITTARDQALLGRAIQERFPKYYAYFSTHTFTYKGNAMRNHNHLLGNVEGVDGIKTGYIAASGFNLVTSVRRNGRHLVAVVLGGRSAKSRDARMKELIGGNIMLAATRKTAPPVVEGVDSPVVVASASNSDAIPLPRPTARETAPGTIAAAANSERIATAAVTDAAEQPPAVGSTGALQPIPVKTVRVKAAALSTAPIGNGVVAQRPPEPAATGAEETMATASAPLSGGKPAPAATPAKAVATAPAASTPAPRVVAAVQPVAAVASSGAHEWLIQVGALETEKDAAQRISTARSKAASILARAKSFTEKIIKNDMTLYRARFAVVSREEAESACKTLKSAKIVCFALRN